MGNKQTILANTVWPTNDGGSITVLEYINSSNILIRHNDNMGHVMTVNSNAVRNGCIKNPYKRSVYGIGYIGVGMYASRTPGSNKPTIEYGVWVSMLQRCYDPKSLERYPTYDGCLVCPEWHCFQTFAEWYCSNAYYGMGYQLDKDILYRGNKLYSPGTCCMVPDVINLLLIDKYNPNRELPTGVYKNGKNYCAQVSGRLEGVNCGTCPTVEQAREAHCRAKEIHIRRIVSQWVGKIDQRVYVNLMNWRIPE